MTRGRGERRGEQRAGVANVLAEPGLGCPSIPNVAIDTSKNWGLVLVVFFLASTTFALFISFFLLRSIQHPFIFGRLVLDLCWLVLTLDSYH